MPDLYKDKLVDCKIFKDPVFYTDMLKDMKFAVQQIRQKDIKEQLWLLEHRNVYTAGITANNSELIKKTDVDVVSTDRGGRYTFHGIGQIVGYVMLDLKTRARDVRLYVSSLCELVILTLRSFGIEGFIRDDRIGVWVKTDEGEQKISAIGVRFDNWVSYHGFAINIYNNLDYYDSIVPCGIKNYGVVNMQRLGVNACIYDVNFSILRSFEKIFSPIIMR